MGSSVSHANLWAVLRAFKIPDIDLLESIYSVANGGTALKLTRLRTKQSSTTLKKQDGGTGSQRKLWHENVITSRTRTGHKGSGAHRTNGKCQSGGVNEKMRGARSSRRKQGPNMRDYFPKEEEK